MQPSEVRIVHKPIQNWTHGKGPTKQSCQFKKTPSGTMSELRYELSRIGVRQAVIQMDLQDKDIRLDGEPRANATPEKSRIIVSFVHPKQGPISFPCWTYRKWIDNVRAVSMTLAALRAMDRYGATKTGQQYSGWKALPAGSSAIVPAQAPQESMGVEECAVLLIEYSQRQMTDSLVDLVCSSMEVLNAVRREASALHHPDTVGGGDGDIIAINKAYAFIKQHIEGVS